MQNYKASVPNKVTHKNRHLTAALREFWKRAEKREGRLMLLREFAARRLANGMVFTTRKYRQRRKVSAAGLIKAQRYRCFVCAVAAADSGHHVIQLQCGGTNVPYNIVPVCLTCHADVHPWMPTDGETQDKPMWS
jgi:hypothetical protein